MNFFSLTFGSLKDETMSLAALVENLSTSISRAGINRRFNQRTCDFLRGVYSHVFAIMTMAKSASLPVGIFKKFRDIKILDSSSWKVPAALKGCFPGYNLAGCKMQFMLSYKTGTIDHLDIGPETNTDQQYSKNIDNHLQKDDLILFDLGFAITEALSKIAAKWAFFLCRFNDSAINIYMDRDPSSAAIDVLKWLNQFTSRKSVYEIPCFVGNGKQKIKVRLLAVRAPEEVANRRRQKLCVQARKKGSIPKERNLKLCDWTLMVTNIPAAKDVSFQEISALYAIRWTIEIFFKQLKSVLNIHKTYVKNNPYRLEAELLARSIVALFITYCFSLARSDLWRRSQREISFEKTVKYFKRHLAVLMDRFLRSIHSAVIYLQHMISQIILSCEKYRQSTRKNSLDKLIEQTLYGNFKHIKLTRAKLVGSAA